MRLQISKSQNASTLYIVESTYDRQTGKRSNRVVKKLGTLEDLSKIYPDPIAWGKELAKQMTEEKKAGTLPVKVTYDSTCELLENQRRLLDAGCLFLQKVYYDLGIDQLCQNVSQEHKLSYDLNEVLKTLVFLQVLFPLREESVLEEAQAFFVPTILEETHRFPEPPSFGLHDLYETLEVLAKEGTGMAKQLNPKVKTLRRSHDRLYPQEEGLSFYGEDLQIAFVAFGGSRMHQPDSIHPSDEVNLKAYLFVRFVGLHLLKSLAAQLDNRYSTKKIADCLRQIHLLEIPEQGFIPVYDNSDLIDALHENAGFSLNFQIILPEKMQQIIQQSKHL